MSQYSIQQSIYSENAVQNNKGMGIINAISLFLNIFLIFSITWSNTVWDDLSQIFGLFLMSLLATILVSQITQYTHFHKETWFAFTILVVHAYYVKKKLDG